MKVNRFKPYKDVYNKLNYKEPRYRTTDSSCTVSILV